MLDSAIYALMLTQLNAGLAARGVTGVTVKQNNQPRQVAASSTPGIYFSGSSRKNFGWPQRVDTWNPTTQLYDRTTTQVKHTKFTIGALVPNASPATPYALTSGDLADVASAILQHEDALAAFRAAGCNVLRVQELPSIWFETSNEQMAQWASFDIIFTHKDVFKTPGNALTGFNGVVNQVP